MIIRLRHFGQRQRSRWNSRMQEQTNDSGNAIVEFLAVALLLLVPLIYLVLVLAKIQAATYAVQGAAKDAGRAYALSDSATQGADRASLALQVALQDQGLDPVAGHLEVICEAADCLTAGSTITAAASVPVKLPGVPQIVQNYVPVSIPVSATHVTVVDQLRAQQ